MQKIIIDGTTYHVAKQHTLDCLKKYKGKKLKIEFIFKAVLKYNRVLRRRNTYENKYIYFVFVDGKLKDVLWSNNFCIIRNNVLKFIPFDNIKRIEKKYIKYKPKVVLFDFLWRDESQPLKRMVDFHHFSYPVIYSKDVLK